MSTNPSDLAQRCNLPTNDPTISNTPTDNDFLPASTSHNTPVPNTIPSPSLVRHYMTTDNMQGPYTQFLRMTDETDRDDWSLGSQDHSQYGPIPYVPNFCPYPHPPQPFVLPCSANQLNTRFSPMSSTLPDYCHSPFVYQPQPVVPTFSDMYYQHSQQTVAPELGPYGSRPGPNRNEPFDFEGTSNPVDILPNTAGIQPANGFDGTPNPAGIQPLRYGPYFSLEHDALPPNLLSNTQPSQALPILTCNNEHENDGSPIGMPVNDIPASTDPQEYIGTPEDDTAASIDKNEHPDNSVTGRDNNLIKPQDQNYDGQSFPDTLQFFENLARQSHNWKTLSTIKDSVNEQPASSSASKPASSSAPKSASSSASNPSSCSTNSTHRAPDRWIKEETSIADVATPPIPISPQYGLVTTTGEKGTHFGRTADSLSATTSVDPPPFPEGSARTIWTSSGADDFVRRQCYRNAVVNGNGNTCAPPQHATPISHTSESSSNNATILASSSGSRSQKRTRATRLDFKDHGPHLPIRIKTGEIYVLLAGARELETICSILGETQTLLLGWINPSIPSCLQLPSALEHVICRHSETFAVIIDQTMSESNENLAQLMNVSHFPTTDFIKNREILGSYDGASSKQILDMIKSQNKPSNLPRTWRPHQPLIITAGTHALSFGGEPFTPPPMVTLEYESLGSPEVSRSVSQSADLQAQTPQLNESATQNPSAQELAYQLYQEEQLLYDIANGFAASVQDDIHAPQYNQHESTDTQPSGITDFQLLTPLHPQAPNVVDPRTNHHTTNVPTGQDNHAPIE